MGENLQVVEQVIVCLGFLLGLIISKEVIPHIIQYIEMKKTYEKVVSVINFY